MQTAPPATINLVKCILFTCITHNFLEKSNSWLELNKLVICYYLTNLFNKLQRRENFEKKVKLSLFYRGGKSHVNLRHAADSYGNIREKNSNELE